MLILPYTGEGASLHPTTQLVMKLSESKGLDLETTLEKLAYLHGGYANIILG